MTSERTIGVITRYSKDRGFGFIQSPSYKEDIYFHFTFIEGGEDNYLYTILNQQSETNTPVTFLVKLNQGRLQAMNIRLLEAGIEDSPTYPINTFLHSMDSLQTNAQDEFWKLITLSNLQYIENDPDLRKLAIMRITKSTKYWEKLIDFSERLVSVTRELSNRTRNDQTQNIFEDFINSVASILNLQILSSIEMISSFSALQVKLVMPLSPIRWFRQAEEVSLLVFLNSRLLRQSLLKDPSFATSTNKSNKLIIILDETEERLSDPLTYSNLQVAIVKQIEIIRAISNPLSDASVILGRILRSFLPIHLMQPFEVGAEYNRSLFSGRKIYRDQVLDNINSNWAVYGGRKIGKSWFLKDICFHCRNSRYSQIYDALYISVQGCECIEDAIDRISEKIQASYHFPHSESKDPFKRLLYYLSKAHKTNEKILLLAIDEIDDVLNMNGCREFLGNLRGYWQNNPNTIKFVFAGFKELMSKFYEEANNFPLANWFGKNHFALSCLDQSELRELIIEPLKWVGLEFDENNIAKKIFELTSGHPYYTQSLGQSIVDNRLKMNLNIFTENLVDKLATTDFFSEVFDIFEGNLTNIQKLIGKVCSLEEKVFSEIEIQNLLREEFGIDINNKQLREELRVLVACSVFIRSDLGYSPLMVRLNKDYFATKDDTALAISFLEED